jgi:hypothetical protein
MKTILSIGLIFLCFLLCLILSPAKLVDRIKHICPTYPCTFDMRDIIQEDWDTMYLFTTSFPQDSINGILGFDYPFWDDVADRIIFTKKKKIICHEDYFPYPEKQTKMVIFDLPANVHSRIFSKSMARFKALSIDENKNVYIVPISITN